MSARDLDARIAEASLGGGKDLLELISAEAERLAKKGEGPTTLVDALVAGGHEELAPTAAERHHHAFEQRRREKLSEELARLSPIFPVDRTTLVAAPVGALFEDGMTLFVERVLSAVLAHRPSKVRLILAGLPDPSEASDAVLELERDLAQQGIRLLPEE